MSSKGSFFSNSPTIETAVNPSGPVVATDAPANTQAPGSFFSTGGGDYAQADLPAVEAYKDEAVSSAAAALASQNAAAVSAASVGSSATDAQTSASNAAASATTASTQATNAAASASAASTSATNAASSASAASGSATSASTSATNAGNSASAAASSQSAAATSASGASTSATNASNSATAASTSASNASTSATNAAGSATAANTSASNAAGSATAANTSASNASTSATLAQAWATQTSAEVVVGQGYGAKKYANDAASSATGASTSASNAASSATAANTSATNASTSASGASTSATNAANSASAASTSATNAASSATAASTSAANAASAADTEIANRAVRYDAAQTLTGAQKTQAQSNIGLSGVGITISGHLVNLGGTLTLAPADVSLANVTNDAQTKAAVMPNTAPLAGQVPIGSGTAYAPTAISGDATLSSAGALLVTKTNGVALGTAATKNVGVSANSVVQLDASGKLPAVDGSQLTGITGGGGGSGVVQGKNRIINGAMTINQRGSGTVGLGYPVDRFAILSSGLGSITYQQVTDAPTGFLNSVKATVSGASTPAAGDYYLLRQGIEGINIADLNFGTASAQAAMVSFWVKSSLTGTFGFQASNNTGTMSYLGQYTINSANTWEKKTVSVPAPTTGTFSSATGVTGLYVTFPLGTGTTYSGPANAWSAANYQGVTGTVQFVSTLNATFQVTGLQLEAGSTATAFENRHYAHEMLLCQRYYGVYQAAVDGYCISSSAVIPCAINFSAPMATAPTMAVLSTSSTTNVASYSWLTSINGAVFKPAGTNVGRMNQYSIVTATAEI